MQPGGIALWAAVLVCAVAATVRVLDRQLSEAPASSDAARSPGHSTPIEAEPNEPDAMFWNVFTGLVVIVPALLIPAVVSPAVGVLMLCLAAAAGVVSLTSGRKLDLHRRGRARYEAARARHDSLLYRWQQYELDPAKAIDYPSMSDVRLPQTSALIRAMREAQTARTHAGTDYARAVRRLERALTAAEQASGVALSPSQQNSLPE